MKRMQGKNQFLSKILLFLLILSLGFHIVLCRFEDFFELESANPLFGAETTTTCYGILANSSSVCSGSGNCTANDNCVCNQEFFGNYCQYSTLSTKTVAGGDESSHFIGYSGFVYSTGRNTEGEIGDGTPESDTTDRIIPRKHADSENKTFIAISGGDNHFLKLDSNGLLYSWGYNGYGGLGNNDTKSARTPVRVDTTGVLKGKRIVGMCSGWYFSVAIDSEGVAYSWGLNDFATLGDGTFETRIVPGLVKATGVLSGKRITGVDCGQTTVMARDSNFTVYGWGLNSAGQLAQPDNTAFKEAIVSSPTWMRVMSASVGVGHSLVLDNNGTAWAVGSNSHGQLGDRSSRSGTTQWVKVDAELDLKGKFVVGVFAGNKMSSCIDSEGNLYTWGYGYFGSTGLGDFNSYSTPKLVRSPLFKSKIKEVAYGLYHMIAKDSKGMVMTWGFNQNGQLGTGSLVGSNIPLKMACPTGLIGDACTTVACYGIDANNSNTCTAHGSCEAPNVCKCKDHYYGDKCDSWYCFGVEKNDTKTVCSSNGDCVAHDTCSCRTLNLLVNVPLLDYDPYKACRKTEFGPNAWSNIAKHVAVLMGMFSCFFACFLIICSPCWASFLILLVLLGSAPPCLLFTALFVLFLCVFTPIVCGLLLIVLVGGPLGILIVVLFVVCSLAIIVPATICFGGVFAVIALKIKKSRDKEKFFRKLVEGEDTEQSAPSFKLDKSIFNLDFKDFKITQEIPTGGSGALCLEALDKKNDEDVFIKLFPMKRKEGSEEYDYHEFSNEISFLSTLRHPNIVNFFGVFYSPPARVGYVCEFCKMGALSGFIKQCGLGNDKFKKKQNFNLSKKLDWLMQIGKGMRYLHQKDVIFRDLKPENVLIGKGDVLKITDFGISRLRNDKSRSNNMTMKAGTSFYMAPEVVNPNLLPKGESYDFKIDVFSFGILMFEVLFETMEPYSEYGNQYGIEFQVCQNPNFRPSIDMSKLEDLEKTAIDSQIIQKLEAMMRNCWSHDPKKRPNFREIVNDISEIQDSFEVMEK